MRNRFNIFRIEWIAVLTASFLSSCATVPSSNDSICSKVDAYETAPFENGQTRRSVTLKWVGNWMDFENGFGKKCEFDSDDAASKELCDWLPDNTSTEFPNGTPISILECYGYEFPSASTWSGWRSQIDIWTQREEPILLEIDFGEAADVIRITVFADGHGTYDDDFVSLRPSVE